MHDLSLYILELIENSTRAKAGVISVAVDFDFASDRLRIAVEDNGEGIRVPEESLVNPFYTTSARKRVGLGLSLFKEVAEAAGGGLRISRSKRLGGILVSAHLGLAHVDRPPLGDLAATISAMILANPDVDFHLLMSCGEREYRFRLLDFRRQYGLNSAANVALASAAFQVLRRDLEIWKRIELSSLMGRRHVGDTILLRPRLSNMEQGADA